MPTLEANKALKSKNSKTTKQQKKDFQEQQWLLLCDNSFKQGNKNEIAKKDREKPHCRHVRNK